MDKITKKEVLEKIRKKKTMWKNLKRRAQLIGHTSRHEGLLKGILRGEVVKKRGREGPRLEYFPQLKKDMRCLTFREVRVGMG